MTRLRFASGLASGFVALALATASGAWAGESSTPDSVASPTSAERIRDVVWRDVRQLGSQQTLMIVTSGGAAAAVCTAFENPDRAAAALDGPTWESVANLGNVWGNGFTQAAGAGVMLVAGGLSHDANLTLAGTETIRSLAYAGALVSLLKVTVNRTRPDGTPYSFPSGHCAVAFAVAPIFTERFGWRAGIPAYLLATATAIGRLEDHKHYLSDDVFGAALGFAVGDAVIASDRTVGGVRVALGLDELEVTYRF